jgi:predicted ATPase
MIYLRSVQMNITPGAYPFNCPSLWHLKEMTFSAPVTILVGENGSGKSTFLEALARKLRLPAIGSADAAQDASLDAVAPLCNRMKTVFSVRPKYGFFLRAEDFFGYTRRIAGMQKQFLDDLARVEQEYRHKSAFTQEQARMAYADSLAALYRDHGIDPDARSHGESFIHLFQSRIRPGGLYLLDEPEAPLSPTRQLALIALLLERAKDTQFILATHSPFLMAYPGAEIWSMDTAPAAQCSYDALDSVALTRDFLNHPDRYIRQLQLP